MRQKKPFYLILFLMALPGCDAILCTKGDSKQGLFFNFGSDFGRGYVNIGAYPTFHTGADFVKKLIVKENGFLLVSSQGTVHCDNREEMLKGAQVACKGHKIVDIYTVRRYTDSGGYEEWGDSKIPEKEWEAVASLNHSFSLPPDYHYKNCRLKIFGGLYQILQIIQRI